MYKRLVSLVMPIAGSLAAFVSLAAVLTASV